ncbi:putative ATP-dependent helicase yeeB [Hyphomicrobium sp. GJ21]|uniref:DEAD/DEAH box helicase n=1 Tax=Hyphomicrobium sp. GJ21 TaxID=113574 RepID=UPI000622B8C9|nr:helicase-related protein [Hyphomicrobium sp. GJ21]CEJ84446.1 putative ATP-dependent helicase yeeB [Hyphomicrobium sp. GJ21]
MPDFVHVSYGQTGASQKQDATGMRAMQARAYAERGSQYLLVKAPPASGKSRALMFIGLDKLQNQGIRKVIVAVPERSIGASFKSTKLTDHGFFRDWEVEEQWNLCTAGVDAGKVGKFEAFMAAPAQVLVCTHATLRFAYDKIGAEQFAGCLIAVDEFHHASADADSRLGEVVRGLMADGRAHIVAMTGSYFRGDSIPVLRPEDEEKFTRISYTYYEQLNGYTYLRTLGIGYHFYRGRYLDAITEVLDPDKKTIIHIPSVNAAESTKEKYVEVDRILDHLGEVTHTDPQTGLHHVRHKSGKILKVADLVEDDEKTRNRVMETLRNIKHRDDVDIIIALGMAKEGFDWTFCEHALTVGYRGSLTEIIQIIGRATRDSPGKPHAQFTNLIAEPDADADNVADAVNNMLKAIAASLLMEQVLAPNFKFKTRPSDDTIEGTTKIVDIDYTNSETTVAIKGFAEPSTTRVRQILESDLVDLTASVMQDDRVLRAAMNPDEIPPEVVTQVYVPKVIETKYPDLSPQEVEEVRQHVVANAAFKSSCGGGLPELNDNLIKMADKFINVKDLDIDLIDSINPFQLAYEIMSKSVDAEVLKRIHGAITARRIQMTEEEAVALWPRIKSFNETHNREPSLAAASPMERRLAEALEWIRAKKRERMRAEQG